MKFLLPSLCMFATLTVYGQRTCTHLAVQDVFFTAPPSNRHFASTKSSFQAKKMISGDFTEAKALKLLFGNYGRYTDCDDTRLCAKWRLTKGEVESAELGEAFFASNDWTVYTRAVMAKTFVQDGRERFILIMQTSPPQYGCHACAPVMGAATFSKVANDWQLENQTKLITRIGSFGQIPAGQLVKIGPDKYGVLFQLGDMHQGVSNECLILIAELRNAIKTILPATELGEDNGGFCGKETGPCYSYRSRFEFVPRRVPDYFNFVIRTKGTKQNERGSIVQVHDIRTYVFSNDRYSLRK